MALVQKLEDHLNYVNGLIQQYMLAGYPVPQNLSSNYAYYYAQYAALKQRGY